MSLIYTDKLIRADCAEEVDVDTAVLREFFEKLVEKNYNFKNIMILRHGKVAAESTKYPYSPEMPCTMFSFAKAITAIAIGFAISDGILRLDTTITELFEDSYDEKMLKKVEGITVFHLLTMTAGKKLSIFDDKVKGDWLDNYINSKPKAKPGEKFIYLSENTYVLGRMLAKVSGFTISEYLRPRLFEPLSIQMPHWNKDSAGFDAGGWGLYLKIEDMAKIAQCFLQKGIWNGVQVIPENWIDEMTVPYTRNLPSLYAKDFGFGYNTWCGGKNNSFRFEGLYGQYILFYPEHDACIVMNSGDINQGVIYDLVDEYFPRAFKENLDVISQDLNEEFKNYLKSISYSIIKPSPRNLATESGVNGNIYKMSKKKYATMLGISEQYFMVVRPEYMDNYCFRFSDDYAEFFWTEKNYGRNVIYISLDGKRRVSNVTLGELTTHIVAYGSWCKDGSLEVQFIEIEVPEVRTYKITFKGKKINVKMKVKTTLYEMIVFEYQFQGMKNNFIMDFFAHCGDFFGQFLFYPSRLNGKLKGNVNKKLKKDKE